MMLPEARTKRMKVNGSSPMRLIRPRLKASVLLLVFTALSEIKLAMGRGSQSSVPFFL